MYKIFGPTTNYQNGRTFSVLGTFFGFSDNHSAFGSILLVFLVMCGRPTWIRISHGGYAELIIRKKFAHESMKLN